jgi:alcohol dehydrogenase
VLAALIDGYGGDQILKVRDFPPPKPGSSDILVKVHAASVNPIDFKLRDGKLRLLRPYRFPVILGHDCAGEVVEIGEQVTRFKVGDRIFSRPSNERIGTFAEFIAIDQSEVALMPPNLNFHEAASLPLVALNQLPSISRYSAAQTSARNPDSSWVRRYRDICYTTGKTHRGSRMDHNQRGSCHRRLKLRSTCC